MFPPGRARLVDEPASDRIDILRHHNGDRSRSSLGGTGRARTSCDYDIYLEAHQFDGKRPDTIGVALTRSVVNNNVFPLHVPKLA